MEGKPRAQGSCGCGLPGLVGGALYETVIVTGLAYVDEVLEAERVALCRARYVHRADRRALRAGHLTRSPVMGGRRVAVSQPPVRSVEGGELRLPSWREWRARAIRSLSGLWSRWCWEYRPGATRVRWSRCRNWKRASAAGRHRFVGIKDVDHRAGFALFHRRVGGRFISLEGSRDIDEGLSPGGVGVAEIILQLRPGLKTNAFGPNGTYDCRITAFVAGGGLPWGT